MWCERLFGPAHATVPKRILNRIFDPGCGAALHTHEWSDCGIGSDIVSIMGIPAVLGKAQIANVVVSRC